MIDAIRARLRLAAAAHEAAADAAAASIAQASGLIAQCFRQRHKMLLCGNGGSAADCQHMAAELVGRLTHDRERPGLPAIALTTDTSFLTAYPNDVNFEGVFARQVQALGLEGDVLLAISTSGQSRNILAAAEQARRQNIAVVALTGDGGTLADIADVAIRIPSSDVQVVQQVHLAIEHVICHLVERELFP